MLVDCIVRMVPGVLHNHRSNLNESFSRPVEVTRQGRHIRRPAILDHPQYTRPESFQGLDVPPSAAVRRSRESQTLETKEGARKDFEKPPRSTRIRLFVGRG